MGNGRRRLNCERAHNPFTHSHLYYTANRGGTHIKNYTKEELQIKRKFERVACRNINIQTRFTIFLEILTLHLY